MTGALTKLRQAAVDTLSAAGVAALSAFEPDGRKQWKEPVVAVSLSKVVCASGGFKDYLGIRRNEATGLDEELYGRGVELTLSLDIYGPRDGGESACRETMDAAVEALCTRGIGGLAAREVESGEVQFLGDCGMYRLPMKCRCSAWLVAAAAEDGEFVDFIVKGRKG